MDGYENGKENVSMEVEDNGCGFEPKTISPDRFGLYNIHERAESIGARVTIESKPECGTIVRVDWVGEEIPDNGRDKNTRDHRR
jgi:signal transduction histidine kinase